MKIPTFKKKLPYSRTCTGFGKINSCFMFTFSQYINKVFWWVKMILQTMRIMLTNPFNLLVTNKVTTQW